MIEFHRRVERDPAVGAAQADQAAHLVIEHRRAERLADQLGLVGGVDFAAFEIEQLGIDRAQPGLPRRLHHDPRDEVVGADQLDLGAADHARDLGIGDLADLGGDPVGRLAPAGIVDQGEDGLDHPRIRVLVLGRQDDHRAAGLRVDDADVVKVGGVAAPADDPAVREVRHLGRDLVLHLDLVAIRHDHDPRPPPALIGDDQLGDHLEDRFRPVEDDRVVAFEDDRAALAQLAELALEAGAEHADQGGDDEDAGQRHRQHHHPKAPALVAAHRSGIERAHQRRPEAFEKAERRVALPGDAEDRDEARGKGDDEDREQAEPADQRDRPRRHALVERVAQPRQEVAHAGSPLRRPRRAPASVIQFREVGKGVPDGDQALAVSPGSGVSVLSASWT